MGRTTLSQIKSQGILVFLLLVPALFGALFFPSLFALTSSHWLGFHIKTTWLKRGKDCGVKLKKNNLLTGLCRNPARLCGANIWCAGVQFERLFQVQASFGGSHGSLVDLGCLLI